MDRVAPIVLFALGAGWGGAACAGPPAPVPRPAAPRIASPTSAPALVPSVDVIAPTVVAPAARSAAPEAAPPAPRPRLTSVAPTSWIYGRPKADSRYIGYVRMGTSVALRGTERVAGERCHAGFYPIEPRGFVCADHTVTVTPSEHLLAMAAATTASPGPLPYRYAFSDGAPMYTRLPSTSEQERAERRLGPPVSHTTPPRSRSSYEDLASTDPFEPVEPAPAFLSPGPGDAQRTPLREKIPAGSMLAFTKVVSDAGRTFLLSADHALVPADRVRLFRKSSFHGVRLQGDVELPLAWLRKRARPRYRVTASGAMERTGEAWPARSYVRLTGGTLDRDHRRFLETRERDVDGAALYLAEDDAAVVSQAAKLPFGVTPDQKWIVVHLGDATLVAYEGMKPVFTTLVSPGRGGIPVAGQDPVEASTTPLGVFYVTFKDRATTMSPDKPGEPRTHWIADVPFTQYFAPPFALHAAYWHDRFGEDTSAGCINVSPVDAELLFGWSDPPVPPEWQGATGAGAPENGPTTAIVVRR